jgi:hypothetical protein
MTFTECITYYNKYINNKIFATLLIKWKFWKTAWCTNCAHTNSLIRDLDEKKCINNRRRNTRPNILLLLLYFLLPSEILSENSTANFLRIGSDKYFRA